MAAAYIRNGAKRIYIASRKLDDLKRVAAQLNELSPNKGGESAVGRGLLESKAL